MKFYQVDKKLQTIVNGDEKIKEISAASIIAKFTEQSYDWAFTKIFQLWESNFGYGTNSFRRFKKIWYYLAS